MLENKSFINPQRVIRIYKRISSNKNKVWVAHDFNENCQNSKYLNLLVKLKLIEIVPAIYKCGNHNNIVRETKGYKFLK